MYTDHFKLTVEPFALTPDPDFLYLSPDHREALAAIQYGLLDGRGFITLIGEVGTGKTTLLYTLLARLGPEVQSAYVAYTAQSFEQLLTCVLRDLGAEPAEPNKPALLEAFNASLLRRADEGRTTALVIDEAQNLSDETFEELRLLSNFESYTRKMLQIVLVGQPELQDRLQQHQLRQLRERVAVRAYINPLPPAEMRRYIEFRLQRAGGSADDLFSPGALRHIIRRAGGVPRRANILCHNALLFTYGRNLTQVTAPVAREAVAEMDERRPGLFGRRALRRSGRPTAADMGRWAAGLAAIAAIVLAALLLVPRLRSEPAAAPPESAAKGARRAPERSSNRAPNPPDRSADGAPERAPSPTPPPGAAQPTPDEPLALTGGGRRPVAMEQVR